MKQHLLTLFLVLAASVGTLFAQSGTCGTNLKWTLDTETGILTISGTGAMMDYTSTPMPWYSYRSSIKTVIIESSVTSIGNYAFWGCSSLTSIEIPNSITSIGEGTFWGCSSLTSIEIPNSITSIGNYAFIYCSSLTSIIVESGNTKYDSRNNCNAIITTATNTLIAGCKNTIVPNSVTFIGEGAFCGCSSLTSVTIPNSVTSIGDDAFCNCSSLTSVAIPNSVTTIGDYAFYGCSSLTSVAIPNSVTTIGKDAFYGCSGLPVINNLRYADTYLVGAVDRTLSTYSIKEGTKWIGNSAFYNCSSLTSIIIPNSIKCIGDTAFSNCCNLTSISIPNSVTSIGDEAFFNCNGLTYVTIGNSVTTIGDYAFYSCNQLTSITIGNSVTTIGNYAFAYRAASRSYPVKYIHFTGTMADWCTKSFNPSSISSSYTLYINGEAVTNAVIPNSITSIGQYAFDNCSSLTSITIPNSVTSIGYDAFRACSGLTSIEIPNSVTSIGGSAFYNCSKLTSVTMESTTPPEVGDYIFPSSTIIYVPLGSLNTYKASDWKNYDIRVFDLKAVKGKECSTSAMVTINASLNGENKNKYIKSCGVDGGSEEYSGNTAEHIGLEPESEYQDVPFFIKTTKGDIQTITASFTTSALTLTTLQSKAVSVNTSILLAETNMSDSETSCGFEWRRNDQPADMPSNQVLCPVANGLMAGRLKGLKDDVYYKYRAFYKSAAGKMYYGDWQYVFTGDVTVEFDPVLYTYAAQFVSERKATLKGYALAGSDDFTEQGFEYWAESRRTDAPARRAPQYAIGEKHTVKGTGISMRVTLEDLDEGTVYKYRTYAKVGGKTLYGSEMSFTTQGTYEDPIETDLDLIPDADADEDSLTPTPRTPQARKYLRNGILYIEHNGITYTAQGQRLD